MNKKFTITAFFLLFLFALAPTKSFAILNDFVYSEIFSADSTKMLTKEAKIIIKGEVKSVKSSKGINDVVYTRASVLVSEIIKGKVSKKNITVEYKKDEIDTADSFESLETASAPLLNQGEEVVLFLTNSFWRKNVYYLVGGSFGKYAICVDNTIKMGSSCSEESETTNDEQNQDTEIFYSNEKSEAETKTISDKKETLDDLLSEIKNVE